MSSSWITGLADKAENILNKLDQNAATALTIPGETVTTDRFLSPTDNSDEITITDKNLVYLTASNQDLEISALQQRILDLELLTQNLTLERDRLQNEFNASQFKTESCLHSKSELEANLVKLQQQNFEQNCKLEMQINETEQQRRELEEYRTKAQRGLHIKDSLIAQLKLNANTPCKEFENSSNADTNQLRLLQNHFEILQREHQQVCQENHKISMLLERIQHDSTTKETEHLKLLQVERQRATSIQSDLNQELSLLRQKLNNLMTSSATRLQEKEQQLHQLLAEKSTPSSGEAAGLEIRVKSLTQALVDKQNIVENITADRNALRIQLEKLQEELRTSFNSHNAIVNMSNATRNNALLSNGILSNSTDDVKMQFPLLLRETPFDTKVTRKVKRAYSSLDTVGIRLGAFLRRYPLMRIFVLMYVGLLHLWVIFVLLSSTPNQ